MLIDVDYDARAVRAETGAALFVFSDAFSHPADPSALSIERFAAASLYELYPPVDREEESEDDVLVRELRFSPLSARLELSSIEGTFQTLEVFYEKDTFEQLREFYVSRERSNVRFVRSENIVRVINDSDPSRTHLGLLTVEVIV